MNSSFVHIGAAALKSSTYNSFKIVLHA